MRNILTTSCVAVRMEGNGMTKAAPEQLRSRLELRRSNAAQPHRNRYREEKRPGKGTRSAWKKAV
jgi:hypothetical protein